MTRTVKVRLATFGRGGHLLYLIGPDRSELSGYETPESFVDRYNRGEYSARDRHGTDYNAIGAVVIDKRPALDISTTYAIASPLVDIRLADSTIERFHDIAADSMFAEAVRQQPGNAYGAIVRAADRAERMGIWPGPLDSVDVGTYTRWWQQRGARVGVVDVRGPEGITIVWDQPPTDRLVVQLLLPGTPEPCDQPSPRCATCGTDVRVETFQAGAPQRMAYCETCDREIWTAADVA